MKKHKLKHSLKEKRGASGNEGIISGRRVAKRAQFHPAFLCKHKAGHLHRKVSEVNGRPSDNGGQVINSPPSSCPSIHYFRLVLPLRQEANNSSSRDGCFRRKRYERALTEVVWRGAVRTHSHLRNVLIMYKRTFLIKEGITAKALNNHGNLAKRKRVDCHIYSFTWFLCLSLCRSPPLKKRACNFKQFFNQLKNICGFAAKTAWPGTDKCLSLICIR